MLTILTHAAFLIERARRPARGDRGASLVEYVLLLSLITLVCIAALKFFGGAVSSRYTAVGSSLG